MTTLHVHRPLAFTGLLLSTTLLPFCAGAQTALDNIRPVARVCLADQPCVGKPAANLSQPITVPDLAEEDTASVMEAASAIDVGQSSQPEVAESAQTPEEVAAGPGRDAPASEPEMPGTTESTTQEVTEPETDSETGGVPASESLSEPKPEPAVAQVPASSIDVAATYQTSCFACHGSGAAGAPRIGDTAAWEKRLSKGMDVVMENVMNGINTMPAKGLCFHCSYDDLRAIVEYMISPGP